MTVRALETVTVAVAKAARNLGFWNSSELARVLRFSLRPEGGSSMRTSTQSLFAAFAFATLAVSPGAGIAADVKGAAPTDPALIEKIRASNAEFDA